MFIFYEKRCYLKHLNIEDTNLSMIHYIIKYVKFIKIILYNKNIKYIVVN